MESARALSSRQRASILGRGGEGSSAGRPRPCFTCLSPSALSRGLPAPKVIAGLTARSVAIPFGDLPSSLRAAESTVVRALYQDRHPASPSTCVSTPECGSGTDQGRMDAGRGQGSPPLEVDPLRATPWASLEDVQALNASSTRPNRCRDGDLLNQRACQAMDVTRRPTLPRTQSRLTPTPRSGRSTTRRPDSVSRARLS